MRTFEADQRGVMLPRPPGDVFPFFADAGNLDAVDAAVAPLRSADAGADRDAPVRRD